MAFNKLGFVTVHHMGTIAGTAGETRNLHTYLTNDDTAGVQTTGYFNDMAHHVKIGDIIMCSLDNDGAPMLRNYVVSNVAAGVVTIAAQNVA